MSFSYLNNANLKFNNNSFWFAKNRNELNKFVLIELLLRERLRQKLIKNKDFYVFDINTEIREKSDNVSLVLSFKYQLSYKRLKNEEIAQTVQDWIKPICKRFNITKVHVKPSSSVGEKSAFCFAQVLANEMSKYISNKKIRTIAKSNISNKILGYIIKLKGRINGNSIARKDKLQKGLVSRNTLKYDIEFATFTHIGKSGCVGIKVWINRGLLPTKESVIKEMVNNSDSA